MNVDRFKRLTVLLAGMLLASASLAGVTVSSPPYNPWLDVNDDGVVDITDIAAVIAGYGMSGDPVAKAALEYDSGWLNITDKRGQSFDVVHGLNSTSIMVEVTGKAAVETGPHQNHYGLTTYIATLEEWNQTYGGTGEEGAWSVVQTLDGGYAIAGATTSSGAGSLDFWLVKTDALGNPVWNQTYGGNASDTAWSVIQTVDGGYAIVGYTASFGAGAYDVWLIKTDASGNHAWNQTYGGTFDDFGVSVVQTLDDGYAIAGATTSSGAGGFDAWLVKTNASGNPVWNQTYGGTSYDDSLSVVQTLDDGYAIAGTTQSAGAGGGDFWLVKTDALGNPVWNQTYGGIDGDWGFSVIQTLDDGYAIVGNTASFGAGAYDVWLIKTDASGNHAWNQTYGGIDADEGNSVVQTVDGGYAIAGYTYCGAGGRDFWLVKTDALGNPVWNQTYGGNASDTAWSVIQTVDGGYAIAGGTMSFGAGSGDFWLVKAYGPEAGSLVSVEYGLAWTASTENTITLYRGADDPNWNYVRVRIWRIKDTP